VETSQSEAGFRYSGISKAEKPEGFVEICYYCEGHGMYNRAKSSINEHVVLNVCWLCGGIGWLKERAYIIKAKYLLHILLVSVHAETLKTNPSVDILAVHRTLSEIEKLLNEADKEEEAPV
jgi:hypothetical protein